MVLIFRTLYLQPCWRDINNWMGLSESRSETENQMMLAKAIWHGDNERRVCLRNAPNTSCVDAFNPKHFFSQTLWPFNLLMSFNLLFHMLTQASSGSPTVFCLFYQSSMQHTHCTKAIDSLATNERCGWIWKDDKLLNMPLQNFSPSFLRWLLCPCYRAPNL